MVPRLLVEVADSLLACDCSPKSALYARRGVPALAIDLGMLLG